MKLHSHVLSCLCTAVLLATGGAARAQVLADKVPGDALLYAGWAGSDTLGPAYNASHLKAFLEALNLPQVVGTGFSQAMAAQANPQQAEQARFALELLTAIAKAPTAVYVGPFDLSINPAQPQPRIAIFSKVGKAAAEPLATRLNTMLLLNRRPGQAEAKAHVAGDFLLLNVGETDLAERLAGGAMGGSLSDAAAFKNAMTQLGIDHSRAAAAVYFDGQAVAEMLATAVQSGTNPQVRQYWPAIADGLGLSSLQQAAWAGSFDGADWQSATFMGMRQRRPGLMAFFDNPPLSQESLKLIPRSATSAGAFRFDGMRMLNDITAAAGKVNDQAPKQIETALTNVYVWSGIDLKRELLPALGDEYIYYASPEGAGNSLRGFTLVNRLRDAKKAEAAVAAIETFANLMIQQRDPGSKLQFATRALPAPWDKVTAHVMPLDNATPSWAIHNGVLYLSVSLPALQSALEMSAGGKPTILDNPQFTAMRRRVGRESFSAFTWGDLPRSFPETYELLNLGLTSALARNPQAYVLPPLDRITPTLGPTMSVSWTDAQGYHVKESSPFPLAGYLSPSNYVGLLFAQQIQRRQTAPPPPANGLP